MRFWPNKKTIHTVRGITPQQLNNAIAPTILSGLQPRAGGLYQVNPPPPSRPVGPSYFNTWEPTPGDTFRQLVKSAVEREEWRGKIQDYLDEAFANECTIEYHDFKRATVALGQTKTQKILTIMWDVPDANED